MRSAQAAYVAFEEWTGARQVPTLGTNAGAAELPFQGWRRFKEAFAPELVRLAAQEAGDVTSVIDPFGGSGTTALAAQFLGLRPTTIEVNPFLADLIEAKICRYDMERLVKGYSRVAEAASGRFADPGSLLASTPPTFVEPGVNERYLFSTDLAARFCAYRNAIQLVEDEPTRRLLRVLLGAVAVPASNALVSGKGRRYKRRWQASQTHPNSIDQMFEHAVLGAMFDIRRYEARRCREYDVFRGDARKRIHEAPVADLAIFSPPYPNSFDYTDVYNIELWMMGYLNASSENRALREATLRSHVQVKRDFTAHRNFGGLLAEVIGRLDARREQLWDRNIPSMIGAYFTDLEDIMETLADRLRPGARVYMVVGDSRYAGIDVPVAAILAEQVPELPFRLQRSEPFRSMRASPQQGGAAELRESLLVFERL